MLSQGSMAPLSDSNTHLDTLPPGKRAELSTELCPKASTSIHKFIHSSNIKLETLCWVSCLLPLPSPFSVLPCALKAGHHPALWPKAPSCMKRTGACGREVRGQQERSGVSLSFPPCVSLQHPASRTALAVLDSCALALSQADLGSQRNGHKGYCASALLSPGSPALGGAAAMPWGHPGAPMERPCSKAPKPTANHH